MYVSRSPSIGFEAAHQLHIIASGVCKARRVTALHVVPV